MDPHHERLLKLVAEGRQNRGLTRQADFIKATGLGRTTIHRFENGELLSDTALRSISWGMGWTADSARTVLDGGEPRPLDDADYGFTRERVSDTVELVSNVIRRVFVAVVPGTPISEVLEAEKLAVELFRAEGLLPPASTTAPDISPRIE